MKIYSIYDKEFSKLGKVIENPFYEQILTAQKDIALPESGASYLASVPAFETQNALDYYREYFGDMDGRRLSDDFRRYSGRAQAKNAFG